MVVYYIFLQFITITITRQQYNVEKYTIIYDTILL